jgi:glutamine synthetase
MGSAALSEAIKSIREWSMNEGRASLSTVKAADAFGSLVFNDKVQQERLPKPAYRALRATITRGETLDVSTADAVATALKDWAVEHGATHYTHWFQPLTGITAEKHDSFLAPNSDGTAIAEFRGKELIKGEPDASSFPSGGMRSTFEARGYTAWDPTSPPWLHVNGNNVTLVIPTAFVSWTGEALDKKTPLLRSMEAVSKQAVRVLKLFGSTAERVFATCGPEQEYFLIDQNFYFARPDLINAGRTLLARCRRAGDETSGAIPSGCSHACEAGWSVRWACRDAPRRGRRVRRSRQSSRRQHAPIISVTMEMLRRSRRNASRRCSPEAVRGHQRLRESWSLSDEFGNNLLGPGDTPHDNMQFLVFCAAVLRAVDRWQGLLRASIASAGNDHRLGANEAPPAILSIFLGDMLTELFEQIEKGGAKSTKQGGTLDIGVSVLPKLPRDSGDRNRTSPFAFTGNKFEFRAVSSGQNIAFPNTMLNAAMADALDGMATELETATKKGEDLNKAVAKLLTKVIKEHKRIIFNGNNYAAEWEKEATKRKLLNLKNTVDALPQLVTKDAITLLDKYKILNEREVHARYEVFLENYNKTINVEGQLMVLMTNRYIVPAALEYQKRIGQSVTAVRQAGSSSAQGKKLLSQYTKLTDQFKAQADVLAAALEHSGSGSAEKHAKYMRDKVVPAMAKLRTIGDEIEVLTPHEIWPLPTYREMLFVK